MQYRKFGKTNEMVSPLGFGLMRLPVIDGNMTEIDEGQAMEMVKTAIDNGVNYFDTAWPYHSQAFSGPGASEPFLGKILKTVPRESVKIATKLPVWDVKTREDMDRIFNEQIKRLDTDYIDFYLLHALNKNNWKSLKENDVLGFINDIQESGKIKHIGFSFHDDTETFKQIIEDYAGWEFCQIQYNYYDTDFQAGEEGLNYAYEKGLGVAIMEPLRGGSLSMLVEEDLNTFKNVGLNQSPTELALKWLWNDERISVVLSGMSILKHVEQNIASANNAQMNELNAEQLEAFKIAKQEIKEKTAVPCTGCGYCTVCPVGVNIPLNFKALNDYTRFNGAQSIKAGFKMWVEKQAKAAECIACGKCEEHCPQKIKISEELKKLVEVMNS